MSEMTWDEALEIVVADTRREYPDNGNADFESDVAVLYHVWNTVTFDTVVRYDVETDNQTDPLWRNAVAHRIFLGEYRAPRGDDLRELVRLLSSEGVVQLTTLQELWIYQINHA